MADMDKQNTSLFDRILRKEWLILLVGIFFLGSAYYTGQSMQYFWGIAIICGAVALHFVQKKDWKKHWEEQEELKKRHDAVRARERELKDAGKK
jgi:uncharacterized membrane protein HdeD (DUF308 family)